MSQSIIKSLKLAACTTVIAGTLFVGKAQADEIVVMPPEVIATTTPVYYNGVPSYWWNGRWYYQDTFGWHFYHDEPAYLHEWRGRPGWGGGERRFYEGHPAPMVVNRGGGWRGGGRR